MCEMEGYSMLNIALCDDNPGQLALLAAYTSEFMQSNQYEASIHQFLHPDELLRTCERERFSLYILDIVMPMINGIEVGKTIRKLDREAQIIYATAEPGFALQSFVANPINYLLKPINKQQLFATLALVAERIELSLERTFTVKTHEGLRIISVKEVICCEYSDHTVIYTLASGETITSRTFKGPFNRHIAHLLQDERFLRPHGSYALNMDYVQSFDKTRFVLRGEHKVPIVTKQYAEVRDTFMNYRMAKEKSRCLT